MKQRVLITGGKGGIASGIAEFLHGRFELLCPSKEQLDVTKQAKVDEYLNKIEKLDILINNAGAIHPSTIIDSVPEKWINDINVNLIAPYYVSRQALKHKCKTIINIASTAGYAAYKEWSSYCASKAGLITLTKCMAAEGIDAYAISPGATDTQFRNYFDLPSDNLMSPKVIGEIVLDILNKKYNPGVSVFVRNGTFELR